MSLPELLTAKSKGVNFKPEVVIDIGANRGSWTRTLLGHFPEAKVLLIEASSKHTRSLKKLKITYSNQTDYRIAVLSETSGQQVDFFESGDTGNSMFREQTESYTNAEPTKRETSTLDDLVASSFISQTSINLVKIDVQGAELMVLRGATRVLEQASFVQLEYSVVEYNQGGACYWEVDAYLRQAGYAMLDVWDLNYSPTLFGTPGLGQYDILYMNMNNRPRGSILEKVKFCQGSSSSTESSSSSQTRSSSTDQSNNTTTTTTMTTQQQQQQQQLPNSRVRVVVAAGESIPLETVPALFFFGRTTTPWQQLEHLMCLVVGYIICYLQGRYFRRRRRERTE